MKQQLMMLLLGTASVLCSCETQIEQHDHIATADGTHPTDLGFTYMLDRIEPQIRKILGKYGIR